MEELAACMGNVTWEQAQSVCRKANGNLFLPNTPSKVSQLASLVAYTQQVSQETREYFPLNSGGPIALWVVSNHTEESSSWCPTETTGQTFATAAAGQQPTCAIADSDACNHGCMNWTGPVSGFVCEMATTCVMWNMTGACVDPPFGLEFCRDLVHEGTPLLCIPPGDGGVRPAHCDVDMLPAQLPNEVPNDDDAEGGHGFPVWQAAVIGLAAVACCTVLVASGVWLLGRRRRSKRRKRKAAEAASNGLPAPSAAGKPPGPPASTVPYAEAEGGETWRDERGAALMPAPPSAGAEGNRVREGRSAGPPVVPSDTIRPPCVPAYWSTCAGVELLQDWSRVSSIQELMDATWRAKFTRDRVLRAGLDRVPIGCRLLNVVRVENHAAWARYQEYKEALRSRRGSGLEEWAAATSGKLGGIDLEADVNESYLFHGTSPSAAQEIIRSEFSLRKAGSHGGTMFGDGIYLAENASKSDEYAQEGHGVYHGLCAVLICRAALGRVATVHEPGDHVGLIRSGEYDSLCGDRVGVAGTFRELVLFSQEAVYPEFIANYARTFEGDV